MEWQTINLVDYLIKYKMCRVYVTVELRCHLCSTAGLPSPAKGESICLDRCVARFLEVHDRVGKKLTQMYLQDETVAKQIQELKKR